MKYKVGDKVRIREDLVMGGNYGGSVAVDDMIDLSVYRTNRQEWKENMGRRYN